MYILYCKGKKEGKRQNRYRKFLVYFRFFLALKRRNVVSIHGGQDLRV